MRDLHQLGRRELLQIAPARFDRELQTDSDALPLAHEACHLLFAEVVDGILGEGELSAEERYEPGDVYPEQKQRDRGQRTVDRGVHGSAAQIGGVAHLGDLPEQRRGQSGG